MEASYPVHDDYGREIGDVQRAGLWHARALDGADLGAYLDRIDAEARVRLDWMLNRPRDPRTREVYKAVPAAGPIYLGR